MFSTSASEYRVVGPDGRSRYHYRASVTETPTLREDEGKTFVEFREVTSLMVQGPLGEEDLLQFFPQVEARYRLFCAEKPFYGGVHIDHHTQEIIGDTLANPLMLYTLAHEFGHAEQEQDEHLREVQIFYAYDRKPAHRIYESVFLRIAELCAYTLTEEDKKLLARLHTVDLEIIRCEKAIKTARETGGEASHELFERSTLANAEKQILVYRDLAHIGRLPVDLLEKDATDRALLALKRLSDLTGTDLLADILVPTRVMGSQAWVFAKKVGTLVEEGWYQISPRAYLEYTLEHHEERL